MKHEENCSHWRCGALNHVKDLADLGVKCNFGPGSHDVYVDHHHKFVEGFCDCRFGWMRKQIQNRIKYLEETYAANENELTKKHTRSEIKVINEQHGNMTKFKNKLKRDLKKYREKIDGEISSLKWVITNIIEKE